MKLPLIYTEVSWDHTCNKSCLPINKTKQSITKNISQGYVGHLTSVVNKILPRSMSMCLETINDYNQICFILMKIVFFIHRKNLSREVRVKTIVPNSTLSSVELKIQQFLYSQDHRTQGMVKLTKTNLVIASIKPFLCWPSQMSST